MRTIFLFFFFYLLSAFQGRVHSQTDFQYGLSHRFIVNNFEKSLSSNGKPLSDSSSFSDLPRGMEISLTKHVFNSFHLNGSFRAGFANYQNDSTNSSFWGSDVQLVYSPMFKAVNPYVGLGSGIIRGNNLIDFGFPVNLGINVKVDKAFYINLQVSYRKSTSELRSSFHYGLGLTFRLKEIQPPKKLTPFVPPVIERLENFDLVFGIDSLLIPRVPLLAIADYNRNQKDTVLAKVEQPADDVNKKPIRNYKELNIQNITFEINKNKLGQVGFNILDSVVQYLNFYPAANLKIQGHTDNTGSNTSNQTLSVARAKICFDYFVNKGIESKRLLLIGFGEESPLFDNSTLLGRSKNRRVEFVSFLPDK